MADNDREPREKERAERFGRTVGHKAERKIRARESEKRGIWFWLGMMGLVGWSVAVPVLVGVAVGRWIDRVWPSRASWTLTLLLAGVAVGCLNAWHWIQRESRDE